MKKLGIAFRIARFAFVAVLFVLLSCAGVLGITDLDSPPDSDGGALDGAVDSPALDGAGTDDGGPPVTPVCSANQWCWVNPLPTGNTIAGIWGAAPNDIWAVGAFSLLHYNGAYWDSLPAARTLNLHAVWGMSAKDVWAVGDSVVIHYDGTAWSKPQALPQSMLGVYGTGPNDVWAVGTSTIMHYDGKGWSSATGVPAGIGFLRSVWASGPNDVWVAGDRNAAANGTLLHWNGSTWAQTDLGFPHRYCVWGSGPNDVWVGGESSTTFHKTATGWAQVPQNFVDLVYAFHGSSPNDVWATGSGGKMIHWDGVAWQFKANPASSFGNHSLFAFAPNDIWAGGEGGTFEHWDGNTWTNVTRGIQVGSWTDIHGRAPDDIWTVGTAGASAHWDGTKWTPIDTGVAADLNGVRALSDGTTWAVGAGGAIVRYQGGVWSAVTSGVGTALYKLWADSPKAMWAVGEQNTILRWDGVKWARETLPTLTPPLPLNDITGFGPNDVWVVGGWAPLPTTVLRYNGSWAVQSKAGTDGGVAGLADRALLLGFTNQDVWVFGNGSESHWDGKSWTSPIGLNALAAGGAGSQGFWVANDYSGGFLQYTGTGFPPVASGTTNVTTRFYAAGPGDAWAVGNYGQILRYHP